MRNLNELTRGVRQQERVEEIQGKCCMLLATGKSWEYIGGMVQLMANKQQVAMSQGLLDFGADFQADLERAAEWVARSIRAIDETIRVLKDGLKQSGKKKDVAQRIVETPEIGREILDRDGVKSLMGHGIGSLKSAAFYVVSDVIRFSRVFDRQTNWKERRYDTAVIAAPVYIGDVEYICEVVVEQRPNNQSFYVLEVEIKEKLSDVFKTSTKGGTRQASRSILAQRDN